VGISWGDLLDGATQRGWIPGVLAHGVVVESGGQAALARAYG
jgi:hypothetical protein